MRDFELRWYCSLPHPTGLEIRPPVLQYRYREEYGPANALGRAWRMSDWITIPTVYQ